MAGELGGEDDGGIWRGGGGEGDFACLRGGGGGGDAWLGVVEMVRGAWGIDLYDVNVGAVKVLVDGESVLLVSPVRSGCCRNALPFLLFHEE